MVDQRRGRGGFDRYLPMRSLLTILLLLAGCSPGEPASSNATVHSRNVPSYSPETFRAEVTRLIAEKRYEDAVALVERAAPERQVDHDKTGFIAVAEDLIVLPGVFPVIDYDGARDWEFPGASDTVESPPWQDAATDFARRYNLLRQSGR